MGMGLGFDMTINSTINAVMLALLSFTTISSCMKVPNLEENDGPEVPVEQVQSALTTAWGSAQPDSILLNEFSYLEKDIALSDMTGRLVLREGKTVQKIEENGTDKTYTIVQQTEEFTDNNQSKISTDQRVITVKKSGDPITAAQKFLKIASGPIRPNSLGISLETFFNLLLICKKDVGWDVTCHNLKTWDSLEDPPAPIKQSADCRGLKNCKISKKNISFDLILNTVDEATNTKSRQKILYTAKISPDVPYLSRLMDYCIQGLMDLNKQKFPVTICHSIKDFQAGTP